MAMREGGTRIVRVPQRFLQWKRAESESKNPESGFSLIEVAMAISLLGVLAVATLLTIIPLSRQARINREVEAASAAVRDVLEQVQSTPYNEVSTLYPDGQTITVESLESGQVEVSYEDATQDPLSMQLTISWESPDMGTVTRTFETVKTE